MKHPLILALALSFLARSSTLPLAAAAADESQLVQTIQAASSPEAVGAACDQLQRVGTIRCLPAVAPLLLTDGQLAQSARQVLETMPGPEAGQALIDALPKAVGLAKAGVISSLGVRREAGAVPALASALAESDTAVAVAAAGALGAIGDVASMRSLQAALPNVKTSVREAVVDGLLACAYRQLAEGNAAVARATFLPLSDSREKDFIRTAAFRGLILAAGDQGLTLVIEAVKGNDGAAQLAALQVARSVPGNEAAPALARLLPRVSPALQIALIEALGQRRDPRAAAAVMVAANSPEPAVRLAALRVLGAVGDALAVPLLLETAQAAADPAARKAAREALLVLLRGNVTEALLAQLTAVPAAARGEVILALAGRADPAAVPKLIELAAAGDEATQVGCLRALAVLADASQIGALTRLVLAAKADATRSEAREALTLACQRARRQLNPTPIVQGVASDGSAEGRAALLQVCGTLVDPSVRSALRSAAQDPNAVVREAAIRALCDSPDPEVLVDLLRLAGSAPEANLQTLAVRGYVRLATDEESARVTGKSPLTLLRQIQNVAKRPDDKKVVLASLGTVADPEAIQLVTPMLDDPTVQAEAAQAATQIAKAIGGAHRELATATLQKVIAVTPDPARRQPAEAALKQLEALADYLTAWQVSGPYVETGKDFTAMFEVAFGPEIVPETAAWRLMPAGTTPARPWVIDLLKVMPGEQRVAYLRTRIHAVKEQPAVLELGSDDGVKVWLNGREVYANNTARPLTPASDKAAVSLQPGWNTLLLKITQNNQGWECCARLVNPDGSRLVGLQIDPGRTE